VATPGFKLNIILSAIFMMKMLQNQQAGRTDFFTALFLFYQEQQQKQLTNVVLSCTFLLKTGIWLNAFEKFQVALPWNQYLK
jgi:hypothetical protein